MREIADWSFSHEWVRKVTFYSFRVLDVRKNLHRSIGIFFNLWSGYIMDIRWFDKDVRGGRNRILLGEWRMKRRITFFLFTFIAKKLIAPFFLIRLVHFEEKRDESLSLYTRSLTRFLPHFLQITKFLHLLLINIIVSLFFTWKCVEIVTNWASYTI